MTRRFAGMLGVLVGAGCAGGEPPAAAPTPTAVAAPAPAAAPKGLVVTMAAVGGIGADTPPTKVGLMTALGQGYEIRDGQAGLLKDALQVVKDGKVLMEVGRSVSGTAISRVVVVDPSVSFPWDTHVGDRIGQHKHWDRMTCEVGRDAFAGKALCHAFSDGRIGYLVDGVAAELPAKEQVADLTISGMVWTPGSRARKGG